MKLTKPIAFYVVLIFLTSVLGGVVFHRVWIPAPAEVSPEIRSQIYQAEVVKTLEEFRLGKGTVNAKAIQAEKKLLELAVPEKFSEAHLDLVLAMHAVSSVKARDAKGLENALANLEKIFEKYLWLK